MAKKSNPNKKHQFKHNLPGSVRSEAQAAGTPAAGVVVTRDFSYVLGDVKRLAVIAASLFLLEIALWYLLSSTEVGKSVYGLIKL
jgi:hypothetical protein